jgi:hypothetical protein
MLNTNVLSNVILCKFMNFHIVCLFLEGKAFNKQVFIKGLRPLYGLF